ncbi:hypothetical protein Emed_005421 [Eimeria media]
MQRKNGLLRGVTLALAALTRLPFTGGSEYYEEEITKASASQVDCLKPFNSARHAAGFAPFTQNKSDAFVKDHATAQDFLNMGCEALRTLSLPANTDKFGATIALTVQDGQRADCEKAVIEIQKARRNFLTLPGPYKKGSPPFNEIDNVALVALYNPKKNPELDCYYFSCLKDETAKNRVLVRGLLCASSPIALEQGKEPFTQDEFTRIETAEAFVASSAAASPVPIFSVVAAATAYDPAASALSCSRFGGGPSPASAAAAEAAAKAAAEAAAGARAAVERESK